MKEFYVKVDRLDDSKELQEIAQDNGYRWITDTNYKLITNKNKIIQFLDEPYLCFDMKHKIITYATEEDKEMLENELNLKELSYEEALQVLKEE